MSKPKKASRPRRETVPVRRRPAAKKPASTIDYALIEKLVHETLDRHRTRDALAPDAPAPTKKGGIGEKAQAAIQVETRGGAVLRRLDSQLTSIAHVANNLESLLVQMGGEYREPTGRDGEGRPEEDSFLGRAESISGLAGMLELRFHNIEKRLRELL